MKKVLSIVAIFILLIGYGCFLAQPRGLNNGLSTIGRSVDIGVKQTSFYDIDIDFHNHTTTHFCIEIIDAYVDDEPCEFTQQEFHINGLESSTFSIKLLKKSAIAQKIELNFKILDLETGKESFWNANLTYNMLFTMGDNLRYDIGCLILPFLKAYEWIVGNVLVFIPVIHEDWLTIGAIAGVIIVLIAAVIAVIRSKKQYESFKRDYDNLKNDYAELKNDYIKHIGDKS